MKFTDDHLKWLKNIWDEKALGGGCDCMDYATAQALLARLEAAECGLFSLETMVRAMQEQRDNGGRLTGQELIWLQGSENALIIWRASKGEGDGE